MPSVKSLKSRRVWINSVSFEEFSRGCCGVVSELLGDYLNAQLGLQVEYVCGEKDGGSHAWVELKGVVIDITSDQFEGRPPVYIAARDSWYTSWEEESRHLAVHHPSAWTYREEREVLRAVLRVPDCPTQTYRKSLQQALRKQSPQSGAMNSLSKSKFANPHHLTGKANSDHAPYDGFQLHCSANPSCNPQAAYKRLS